MRELIGGILLAVGLLIAGASGLCSLSLLLVSGFPVRREMLLIVLFGGIPFLIGFGLICLGRLIVGKAKRDAEDTYE